MIKNKNVRLGIIVVCIILSFVGLWPTMQFYTMTDAEKSAFIPGQDAVLRYATKDGGHDGGVL